MEDLRCPFSAPLLAKIAKCGQSEEVIRRGGSEIACRNEQANRSCQEFTQAVNEKLLPLLGHENDLLQVPHSVLQKVQIATVNKLCQDKAGDQDIGRLVQARSESGSESGVSAQNFVDTRLVEQVKATKLRQRKKRQ
jgi:hypothetical protein